MIECVGCGGRGDIECTGPCAFCNRRVPAPSPASSERADLSNSTPISGYRQAERAIVHGFEISSDVGAVFCLEAWRLAHNGRDWHHLLELCALVGARMIDAEGVYHPSLPNDRLLLGLKATTSEFELTALRRRRLEAARAKARRDKLRLPVPVGHVWPEDTGLAIDPDAAYRMRFRPFRLYDRHGSARRMMIHLHREGLLFPRPADAKQLTSPV